MEFGVSVCRQAIQRDTFFITEDKTHALLDSSGNDNHAEAWGMTLVEAGVGLTVAAVMVTLFDKFATAARR